MLSQTWSHGSMDQKFVDTKLHDSRQSECKFFAGIVAAFLEVQQIVCKQGKEDITLMNKQLENAREAMQTTMLHDAIRFIISRDEQQALHETVQMQNEEKLQRVRELFAEKAISRRFEAKLKEIELATTHRMDEILKKSSQRKLENEHLKSRIIALEKEIRIKEDELAESHFKLDLEEKNASEKSIMQQADWDAEKSSLEAINKELTQVQSDSLAQGKCMQMSTDRSDSDAQDLLYKKSLELIDQGEKNIAMSAKLRAIKQLHQTLRRDVEQARLVLLQSINSSTDFDTSVYQHVKLEELLRIRLQNVDLERPSPTLSFAKEELKTPEMVGMEKKEIMDTSCTYLPHVHPFSVIDTSGKGSRLEREVQILRSRCKRSLEGKEKAELELERAVMKLDALQGIKEKFSMISTRDQNRKEVRINMESQLKESNYKLVALSQHTEKLMLHIKLEAIAKAKVLESLKSLKKEHQELVQAHTRLQQDYHTQSKTVNVTMEESQLLRDQLYLMDQKVAEMGHKMDWVRSSTQKELKRAHQEADALRTKLVPGSESPEMQPITGITSRTDASIGSPTQRATADSIKTHGRRGYTQKLIDKDTNVTSRRFERSEKRYALGKSHNGVAKLSKI